MILLAVTCVALSFAVIGGLGNPWLIGPAQRALAAGLTYRPVRETVRDTLAWWDTVPQERKDGPMRSGLTAEREAELLAAWQVRNGDGGPLLAAWFRSLVQPLVWAAQEAGKTLDVPTIRLPGTIRVRGHVTDSEGSPLAKVRVDCPGMAAEATTTGPR